MTFSESKGQNMNSIQIKEKIKDLCTWLTLITLLAAHFAKLLHMEFFTVVPRQRRRDTVNWRLPLLI